MPQKRITQHSIRIVLEDGEPAWAIHAYGVSPHRHATQYDLRDSDARTRFTLSVQAILDEVGYRLTKGAMSERYPDGADGQTWVDRPLF